MKFRNKPKPIDSQQYDIAVKRYIAAQKNNPAISSIYKCGSVKAPGLSDLDIIVFIKKNSNLDNRISLYLSADLSSHDIFMHDIFIAPEELGPDMFFITSIFDLEHLHGKKFTFREADKEQHNLMQLTLLNDQAIVSLSNEFDEFIHFFDLVCIFDISSILCN